MTSKEGRSPTRVSRRDVLKTGWEIVTKGVPYGVMAYGLGRLGIDMALDVPEAADTFKAPLYEPGWLETRNPDRPAFIDPHDFGEKKYLRHMAMHDPLLRRTHARAYKTAIQNEKNAITLKDSYWRHLIHAYEEMKTTTAHLEDVVQVSLFSFASLYSSFYSVGDIAMAFGVYDESRSPLPDTLFEASQYRGNIPDIFNHSHHNDESKIQHFAGFAFLSYTYAHARALGLPEAKTVPRLARLVASVGDTPGMEGEVFALSGELKWEQWETMRWFRRMVDTRSYQAPNEGFFEPGFNSDMLASLMGMEFGRRLYADVGSGTDIGTICSVLDSPMDLVTPTAAAMFPIE